MLTMIELELRKLRGTLILWLCLIAPTLVAMLMGVIILRRSKVTWEQSIAGGTAMWAIFMLPMTITAITTLFAQLEHAPRTWDHLFSLPIIRAKLFIAKGIVTMLLIGGMSTLLALEIGIVGALLQWLAPSKLPQGTLSWVHLAGVLGKMWCAALLLCIVQLWVALRFRSFVAPLVLGIGGTFVGVVSAGAAESAYLPWLMPAAIIVAEGSRAALATSLSVIGSMIALCAMCWHLAHLEA